MSYLIHKIQVKRAELPHIDYIVVMTLYNMQNEQMIKSTAVIGVEIDEMSGQIDALYMEDELWDTDKKKKLTQYCAFESIYCMVDVDTLQSILFEGAELELWKDYCGLPEIPDEPEIFNENN